MTRSEMLLQTKISLRELSETNFAVQTDIVATMSSRQNKIDRLLYT